MSDETAGHGNKPVPFSDELVKKGLEVLRKRHASIGANETLSMSGEMAQGYSLVRLELARRDNTDRLWFEVCVETEPNDIQNPIEARDKAIDHVDVLLDEYLSHGRQVRFQPDWKELDVDGVTVLLRGERTNPRLLSEADALLAEHGFDADGHPVE